MYTLQILDAGETFLHTLGDGPVVLGAGEGAQVRLREADVAPIHARLEPHADGVRLVAEADVRVNGEPVREVELGLGDRIEVGRAVLVVGRTVARAARPEDVLAAAVPRAPRRAPSRRRGGAKVVPILAALALVAVVVVIAMQGDDSAQVRSMLGHVEALRADGRLDEARAEVARLRRAWSDAEDDRLAKLDGAAADIERVVTTRERLVAQVSDPGDARNYAEWSRELRRLEAAGAPDERVAARKVRAQLSELVRARDEEARRLAAARRSDDQGGEDVAPADVVPSDVVPSGVVTGAGASTEQVAAGSGDDTAGVQGAPSPAAAIDADEVRRHADDGHFAQALSLLQAAFEQAEDPATVASLRDVERGVLAKAKAAMDELLAEVRGAAGEQGAAKAAALLQSRRHRFPPGAKFAALDEQLEALRGGATGGAAEVAAAPTPSEPDAATRMATLASLRSQMDAVRTAEERGQFATAARLLREAADAVAARDRDFAERLVGRAIDAELLASWHGAVVAAVESGREVAVEDASGSELTLLRVEGGQLIARTPDGDGALDWYSVDVVAMRAIAKQLRVDGRTAVGLAALLFRRGDAAAAEEVLADVWRDDKALQPDVQRALARGRGEPVDGAGYELRKGEFVSLRELELEQRSKKLASGLDKALRAKERDARDAFVAETLDGDPLNADALAFAMRDKFEELRDRVQRSSLRKQVDKLTEERDVLDAARRHARELIYDEATYFYPYKPPAVSGEKHAEYNRVQAEVDNRVESLRRLWDSSRTKLRVPKKLGDELAQLDWLAGQIARLGGFPAGRSAATELHPLAWARALEPGETITLQTFALTPAERAQLADWRRVEAYNDAVGKKLPSAVRSLLRITNDYRAMFRHRPLAVVETACAGSQMHADEMSQLGYFSHTSPTPGRRTPIDRMRLAGYQFGVSENIAMTGGAQAAHNAWCRSSGHHRNLLAASHREIGIGANGRYWVQNFGGGDVHRSHPAWLAIEPR